MKNELKDKLTGALVKARDLAAKAETEDREFSAEERQQITGWMSEAKGYKDELARRDGDDEVRQAINDLGAGIELGSGPGAGGGARLGESKNGIVLPERNKSIGQQFLEAKTWQDWYARMAPNGVIAEGAKGLSSPPIQFKTLITGTDDASAGAFVVPDRQPGVVELARRPLVMRQLVTPATTGSDTIETVRQVSETNNAAPVAEATAATGTSGTKPESGLVWQKVIETVKTIAHWVPITKRALSDAGQIRAALNNFLLAGLEQALEDQMLTGNGVGENFTGIMNTSGVQVQAFDTDIVRTARRARTKVRIPGRSIPTAYLLHPIDWEAYDLLQDAEQRYFYGGPQAMGTPRLWGLPVVESEAMPQGTGLVGDFRQIILWDREQASVQVSDSHQDFFVRNLLAFLAEMRAAMTVQRPAAFVKFPLA